MAKIVNEGSRIDLPELPELNSVVRELVELGFKVHSPGFTIQLELPVVIRVMLKGEKGLKDVHFELVYKVVADVISRIVEDILEKIK